MRINQLTGAPEVRLPDLSGVEAPEMAALLAEVERLDAEYRRATRKPAKTAPAADKPTIVVVGGRPDAA